LDGEHSGASLLFSCSIRSPLAKDGRGRLCTNNREAYAHAIRCAPALVRKSLQGTNTFVSTQICDAQDRTIGVIRGKVHLGEMVGRPSWVASSDAVLLRCVSPGRRTKLQAEPKTIESRLWRESGHWRAFRNAICELTSWNHLAKDAVLIGRKSSSGPTEGRRLCQH
jgi:hypothetical protein